MNISPITAVALVLGAPLCVFLISLLVSWRYRLQVEKAMGSTASTTGSVPAVPGQAPPPPPLSIRWISAGRDAEEPGPRYTWIAWNQLGQRRRLVQRAFWVAGALHFFLSSVAILSAFHIRLGLRLPYSYELALPELVICLYATGASRRIWAFALLVYAASGLALIEPAGGFLHLVRFLEIYSPPVGAQLFGLAFILSRHLRPIAISLSAFVVFALLEGGLLNAFWGDSAPLLALRRGTYSFGPAIAAHLAGVILFLWMARRSAALRPPLKPAALLLAVAAAAFALAKLFPKLASAATPLEAQPFIVLSCYLVWFIFCGLQWIESRRLMTGDLFHLYLAWAFLTFTGIGFAGALDDAYSVYRRGLVAGAFLLLVVTIQFLLWRYSRHLQRSPAKQLVLLRTFGQSRNAVRLLETLRDTWRLFGSVDLISGTDLAGSILTPAMFEAYLRNRVKDLFLKSSAEVDAAIHCLDRHIGNDGHYPINELRCFSNVWRYAVERLVPQADVALMDLRGFSRTHLGCVFELTQLLNLLPLARIVLLADTQTDREALWEVIQDAWTNLSPASPNRSNPAPQLEILNLRRFSEAARKNLVGRLLTAAG